MKNAFKLAASIVLASIFATGFITSAQAGLSYECWAYKNGSPHKMVHVTADNKSEAENLGWAKFQRLNISPAYVKCK